MKAYRFIIDLNPVPKQSFTIGTNNYTPDKVTQYEGNIRHIIKSQLPTQYIMFTGPVIMQIDYYYPLTLKQKSYVKKQRKLGNLQVPDEEICFLKSTRPDVTDNLNKGILDALNNLLFTDDALIGSFQARKYQVFTDKKFIVVYIKGLEEACINSMPEVS